MFNKKKYIEDLKKLKENTYLAKAKKGYGDAFLKQIDNQILVYSVVSSGSVLTDEKNQERIKIYLENIAEDPRSKGKMLKTNRKGQWRYRIGDYRVIVNIQDKNLVILALEVGHR